MDNISISHTELGKIVATPNVKIDKKKKYMIKSLAFLQLICMTPDNEEDDKFPYFIDIISKAASDVRLLYDGEQDATTSIEQF